jgi:hypothetical protein
MALAFLLETSEVLEQDAERRSSWRQILRDLSPFPTQERGGRRVFRLSERGMAWAGCNSLALQHVFPCGCVGLDSPADARDTARETVRQLAVWEDANAFPSFYTQAARVGYDPNAILENLAGQLRSRHALPNLYLSYAGGGIESCGGITGAVNEMLMQSHEGIIRLFPCWPPDRDARFVRLRARGAFLVSAERRHGEVCSVEIQSLAGGRCRLATPFARRDGLRVCEMESRAVVAGPVVAASVLEWSTERGRTYTVDIRQRVQTDRTTQGI